MKIIDIEGVGPAHGASLQGAGVVTTDDLLATAGKKAGRESLAAKFGISEKLILEWTNHADLMRIDGVGSEYSDLLEAAGVDSPAELAQRNAAKLAATFGELDAARNTVRRIPTEAVIEEWIAQANQMDKMVEH